MEMKELEYMVAAADHPTLTEAAASLGLSQSALSRALDKITVDVGVPLFKRGQRLILTAAGRQYVETARAILSVRDHTYRVIESLNETATKGFSIGLGPHWDADILLNIYDRFEAIHPEVRIDVSEQYSRDAVEQVVRGQLDMCIGIEDANVLHRTGLNFVPLQRVVYLLAIAESNIMATGGARSGNASIPKRPLSDFKDVPYVSYDKRALSSYALTTGLFRAAGFEPLVINSTGHVSFSRTMAANLNAYTFIQIEGCDEKSGLRYFNIDPDLTILKGFYFRPEYKITPAISDFMHLYAAEMKKRYYLSARMYPSEFTVPSKFLSEGGNENV